MDFRSLLQSMTSLSEAETKVTKTGKVHKGDYGTSYDGDDEKKPAASTEKRGRGRPKKGADDSGEVKSYDTKSLGSVFGGGQKPKKDIGTVSKKHSLKEYMEAAEQAINEAEQIEIKPAQQNTQVIQQGNKTLGTVTNPQLANQIKQSIGKGEMTLNPDEEMQEGVVDWAKEKYNDFQANRHIDKAHKNMPGLDAFGKYAYGTKTDKYDPQKYLSHTAKADDYNERAMAARYNRTGQLLPANATSSLSSQEARAIVSKLTAKGLITKYNGVALEGQLEEAKKKPDANKNGIPDYAEDGKGKNDLKKKKVDESISLSESPETLQHIISKYKHEVKNFMKGEELDHDLYEALFDYYFNAGEIPYGTAKGRSGDPYEWITDRFDQDVHQYVVDESSIQTHTQHGLDATPSKLVAVDPKQAPTPFKVDPIQATTDRAINFISGLRKPTNPFSESKTMKDMQLESWSKQLDSLLNEGITVSSSQGQQGAPDSVSVTASDADAQALLSVLRQAGIGGFGAGEEQPQVDAYGVISQGEEEPTGTGTEPQQAPGVVGDGDDMLSLIKKMSGLSAGPVGGEDYEDEEGSDEVGTLEPTSGDEEGSEDSGEEQDSDEDKEETDEGNAFTGKLKQTPQGQNFKMGDKSYKDTSSIEEEHDHEEEETCNECGCAMTENHNCNEEQVNEYANDAGGDAMADTELMKLKALLSVGNDLHKMKTSQSMGNPVRVTESKQMINEWKKLSGI